MKPLWHEAADEQQQLFPVVRRLESTEQRGIHSDDHPFFYDPNTAEVFVGPLGAFHLDMFGTHPDPERKQYYVSQYLSNINKPSFGWGGRVQRNGELRWYDEWLSPDERKIPEEARPHVERAVRQELNLPTPAPRQETDYDDEDLWRESHARWIPQPSLMQSFLAARGINVIPSTPEHNTDAFWE